MTQQELEQQRARIWRVDGNAVRSAEDARGFLETVGFCPLYLPQPAVAAPTFIGAFAGSASGLPDAKHAFADPRSAQATELADRLIRERSAHEVYPFGDTVLLVASSVFPFFYALVGDHNPKAAPRTLAQGAKLSPLAGRVFDAVQQHGPLTREVLRARVGREMSDTALDRALHELWSVLKIVPNSHDGQDAAWDVLYRWSPKAVKDGIDISVPEAISALISKYLEAVVAAEQEEIEAFFSHFASRARIREAINALLAARELGFLTIGLRSLIRMAPVAEQRRHSLG